MASRRAVFIDDRNADTGIDVMHHLDRACHPRIADATDHTVQRRRR